MDIFPDIRSFSFDELTDFLAALLEDRGATGSPTSSAYDAHLADSAPLDYRRQVLNNKIGLVRAELAERRRRPDPGNG